MNQDTLKTLLSPFEAGECALPLKALFLRAELHSALDSRWKERLVCVQTLKSAYDALLRTGFQVGVSIPDELFDVCLVRLTKHKQESLGLIAQGFAALKLGGMLHVAGAKDEGIESIEKLIKGEFGAIETRSKHHARTFWLQKPDSVPDLADALCPQEHIEGYMTAQGMFSFGKIDAGSKLLAAHLPPVIKGRVADFGAGWGYLSREVLSRCPNVHTLDVYEGEAKALECAKLNLDSANANLSLREGLRINYEWRDITADMPTRTYDFIVMNPPFHEGKLTKTSLGQAFISAASKAMRPGGRLFMVANRALPYEAVLKEKFSNVRILADESGFRVFDAKR